MLFKKNKAFSTFSGFRKQDSTNYFVLNGQDDYLGFYYIQELGNHFGKLVAFEKPEHYLTNPLKHNALSFKVLIGKVDALIIQEDARYVIRKKDIFAKKILHQTLHESEKVTISSMRELYYLILNTLKYPDKLMLKRSLERIFYGKESELSAKEIKEIFGSYTISELARHFCAAKDNETKLAYSNDYSQTFDTWLEEWYRTLSIENMQLLLKLDEI